MWTIATEVPWSVYDSLLVTTMSGVKMAEPIEMPFGPWTQVGQRNRVFGGNPDPSNGRGNFRGISGPM